MSSGGPVRAGLADHRRWLTVAAPGRSQDLDPLGAGLPLEEGVRRGLGGDALRKRTQEQTLGWHSNKLSRSA